MAEARRGEVGEVYENLRILVRGFRRDRHVILEQF
jgi:hypothetical protein